MADPSSIENDFLSKITGIIEANISNERFGVSELSAAVGMSRSNLLRKIKKTTNLSVSQFIRQLRLQHAMTMLQEGSLTVSEVSYEVGFGSSSYFVKCFHDHYGYPPGEVSKRDYPQETEEAPHQVATDIPQGQFKMAAFWQELKRRKVVKVIIVYASISFILLQLLSILIKPLFLPDWIMTLVIVLLAIGFPIAIIFSWIFDITSGGLEVTTSNGENGNTNEAGTAKKTGMLYNLFIATLLVVVVILAFPKIMDRNTQAAEAVALEKSIAVLPFKNDSDDASNVYIVNGLMESVLNNLQKIEDLQVISRTSVEKYRKEAKTIPEIAKELEVSYFVEGSGQKIGDQILLNIQLIEAATDTHLWAEQYSREAKDIFALQQEVAKNIASQIEAIITPEEEAQINKVPTDNLLAYDYFLQGQELFYLGNREGLERAITLFKKAIELDNEFAHAHADIAIAYYYLDVFLADKEHTELINDYADKALLFDAKLPQSLIAKALYYLNNGEQKLAVPYLEKALEYNPNSAFVIRLLSEFYTNYMPDTAKYLEYALKGVQLDIAAHDSITASFIYLHLSNAFIQSGFVDKAEKSINKSLAYDSNNLYSAYVKAYIQYASHRDLAQTKTQLIRAYNKDISRVDIIQEIAKISYYMRDYQSAYDYYSRYIEIKEAQQLDIFRAEDAKIAVVFEKMGMPTEADRHFNAYLEYANNDTSIYKDLSLSVYYAHKGNNEKAIEHMELFSLQDNYQYWIVIFLEIDPLVDKIKEEPEFQELLQKIKAKFWSRHQEIKVSLEGKNLL